MSDPTPLPMTDLDLTAIRERAKLSNDRQHGDCAMGIDGCAVCFADVAATGDREYLLARIDALTAERDRLLSLVSSIDHTLRVPAAEYVPAIGDVFTLIDRHNAATTPPADHAAGVQP